MNAIAPKSDLTKTGRAQYATLFRVADSTKRGLISWDDFVIFETILKRSDADYWIAFQYFDVYVPLVLTMRRQRSRAKLAHEGTTREPSRTTSSRTCSRRRSRMSRSPSTSIGTRYWTPSTRTR